MPSNAEHWNDPAVESMYDKTLLRLETENLKAWIEVGSDICDFGCGEGEATLEYAGIEGVDILAVDNSPTRLELARQRIDGRWHVDFQLASVLGETDLGQFDVVISQRLLVNLGSWEAQKRALKRLFSMVRPGGRVLLSEGSSNGAAKLNEFRDQMGLPPIPIPAHNVFIDDRQLMAFADSLGWRLEDAKHLGTYYLLTRGVQPALKDDLRWDSDFNTRSSKVDLLCTGRFSRIKQWCFVRG